MEKSVSIAATFTADLIFDGFKFIAGRLGQDLDISFTAYGQVFQQLLEPGSEFSRRQSGWNIIFLRVADLLSSSSNEGRHEPEEDEAKILALSKEFSDAVFTYSNTGIAPVMIVVTPSNSEYYSRLSQQFTELLSETIGGLPTVHLVASADVAQLYPVDTIFEDESDRFGHVPYTETYFAALASYILRFATILSRREKKVIVLDCDNTLWKGVCGEDGYLGVSIKGGHRILQSFMMQQLDNGRLVCLVSKNVESDVKAVFKKNPQMLIPWEKLTAWQINWQPKSENIKRLAAELDLSLDSFVFLDDNPVEIAEVTANCPQVLSIQVPKDDKEIAHLLNHIWVFDKHRVTDEDKKRADSYRDNIKRNQLFNETSSFSDFLEKLDLQIDFEELNPENQARVAQLSQRTNQFNTTTRRHDEVALRNLAGRAGAACHTVRVKDRFGDYGLVGVIMVEASDERLMVTDFMLSCRALGKGVEHKMLAYVGELASRSGCVEVDVQLIKTARNDPAQQFLNSLDSKNYISGSMAHYRFDAALLAEIEMKPPVFEAVKPRDESNNEIDRDISSSSTTDDPIGEYLKLDRQILEVGKLCSFPQDVVSAMSKELKDRPSLQQAFSKPKEGIEMSLARMWQRVLRLKQVGRSDRFTDLGGTSVQLVKIHTLIYQEMGVDVPITALFKYATVSALAKYLQSSGETDNRMVAARERAVKSRAANRANFKRLPRRSNG